jgi:hypothetical protein
VDIMINCLPLVTAFGADIYRHYCIST